MAVQLLQIHEDSDQHHLRRITEPSQLFGRLIGLCQQLLRHLCQGLTASAQLAPAMLAAHTFANIWNVAVGSNCLMASCHYKQPRLCSNAGGEMRTRPICREAATTVFSRQQSSSSRQEDTKATSHRIAASTPPNSRPPQKMHARACSRTYTHSHS